MEYQAVSGSCPSSRPWRPCSGRAHALPVPSSLQIPSVPLTSNFTFFLGKILDHCQNTLLALFLPRAVTTRPHGMAGDEDLPQSEYKYLGSPNGRATSAGHRGKSRPRSTQGASAVVPHERVESVPPAHPVY